MSKANEPAFPNMATVSQHGHGLTKLEYTAIQMHAAFIANDQSWESKADILAKQALEEANSLWDELEKETSK